MTTQTTVSNYEQQAIDFMKETSTTLVCKFKEYAKYFPDDKEPRNVYRCTLKNKNHSYTFSFGTAIANMENKPPTAYDVLTALTKNDPYSFENFCSDYGYDTDSRKAEKIYKACCKEYEAICKLFTEEQIEALQEIQ